ncbi:MAG: YifB family Mg chelatase-like AAA ATPase [Chloroflexota bacterium]
MLAKVISCAVIGLEGALVEVEVDINAQGMPSFTLVGLPDTAVQEARERVRAAIKNSGAAFPAQKRITVNLAPADLKKEGPAYDLPIALGILLANEQVVAEVERSLFLGELSLDGTLRHTDGILPMVSIARDRGVKRVFVPAVDAAEAALLENIEVFAVPSLAALIAHLREEELLSPYRPNYETFNFEGGNSRPQEVASHDFCYIKGQEHVKRALEVAAAGGHNLLMSGPPGSGKTLLARSTVTILPRLTIEEALEATKIYSVSGLLPPETPLLRQRPFRAPHHTISHAGLVGGGRIPRPGEISLAHRGGLFMDELPEFGQQSLETLRTPLEDKTVTISRASGTLSFPANFILLAAMNPCPCGFYGDLRHACSCSPSMVTRYQKRLSGPFLDRIDIHIEVPRIDYEKLADGRLGEPSAKIRARVETARERQLARFTAFKPPVTEENKESKPNQKLLTNAEMGPAETREFCQLDSTATTLMKAATRQLNLSARAYNRVLKLARTIADLAASENIQAAHLAEAIQYRRKEQS